MPSTDLHSPSQSRRQLSMDIQRLEMESRQMEGILLCQVAGVHDPKTLESALAFARLVALWLVHVATQGAQVTWVRVRVRIRVLLLLLVVVSKSIPLHGFLPCHSVTTTTPSSSTPSHV